MRDVERAFDQREQVLAAALDDADRLLAVRGNRGVFAHQLRVTEDAVERRAQLVADGADVAALGLVRLIGGTARLLSHPACALQCLVGLAVRIDLLHQQMRLPVRFFLRHLAALVRQHHPPCHQTGNHGQRQIGFEKARAQRQTRRIEHLRRQQIHVANRLRQRAQFLVIEQAKNAGQQRRDHQHQQQEVTQAVIQIRPKPARQQPVQRGRPLRRQTGLGLAHVATARIERAAQRTDGALVGRAMRHVRCLVFALTDHAAGEAGAQKEAG